MVLFDLVNLKDGNRESVILVEKHLHYGPVHL